MPFRFRKKVRTHGNSSIATLVINASTSLPDGNANAAYSTPLSAVGGVLPYAWAAVNSLPAGLSVASTGTIDGTPSTTGDSTFTVQVTDAFASTASAGFRLQVISSGAADPLSIVNSTGLPQGIVGSSYTVALNSTGGVAPYSSYSLIAGALPAGITLQSTGTIAGTPSTSGASTFTLQVKDTAGSTARQSFRVNVVSTVGSSVHDYFNRLAALPEAFYSNSLRASSLINAVGNAAGYFSYVFGSDTYESPQDAAKLTFPSTEQSLTTGNQLHFPIQKSSGTVAVAFDIWFGPEWTPVADGGHINPTNLTHKFIQFAMDVDSGGAGQAEGNITIETRNLYTGGGGVSSPGTPETYFARLNHRHSLFEPADGAIGSVSFTGSSGVVIPSGSALQFGGKAYQTQHAITIANGVATVSAEGDPPGNVGAASNLAGPSTGTLVSPPAGVSSVVTLSSAGFQYGIDGSAQRDPVFPTGSSASSVSTILLPHGTWIRYVWTLGLSRPSTTFADWEAATGLTLTPGATYHAFSHWVMTPTSGPTRALFNVPINDRYVVTGAQRDTFNKVWLEINTSTEYIRAQGYIRFTGTDGTVVPKGTAATANGFTFTTRDAGTIGSAISGEATIRAQASIAAGPNGNIPVGTVMTVVPVIAGLDGTATAATAFTGGAYVFSAPVVAYFRNFVAALNYSFPATPESDTNWFVRPST